MASIESLRREVERLKAAVPSEKPATWPPKPGSLEAALLGDNIPDHLPEGITTECEALEWALDRAAAAVWS